MDNPKIEVEYKYLEFNGKYRGIIRVFIPTDMSESNELNNFPIAIPYVSNKLSIFNIRLTRHCGYYDSKLNSRVIEKYFDNSDLEELKSTISDNVRCISSTLEELRILYIKYIKPVPEKEVIEIKFEN